MNVPVTARETTLCSGEHATKIRRPVAAPTSNEDGGLLQDKTLSLRFITSEPEFLALREPWTSLCAVQNPAFPERSFFWAWDAWETIARPRGHKLHIVVGLAGQEIVLILPLVIQREWPIRIGRWLGPEIGECSDILVKHCDQSEQWTAKAWMTIASRFHLLRIPALRADAMIWPYIDRIRSQHRTITSAPYIDCGQWPDWQTYLRSRSRPFREDLRRSYLRLRRIGEPRLVDIDRKDQVHATLDWIFAAKVDRFGGKHQTKILAARMNFCRRLCLEALESGRLIMSELWADDTRIAAQWAIRSARRLHTHMVAWDQSQKHCGPGRVMIVETIKWAFQNRIDLIDMGVGKNEFKYRYTDKEQRVATDIVVAFGALDRLLSAGVGLSRFLRQGLRRLR